MKISIDFDECCFDTCVIKSSKLTESDDTINKISNGCELVYIGELCEYNKKYTYKNPEYIIHRCIECVQESFNIIDEGKFIIYDCSNISLSAIFNLLLANNINPADIREMTLSKDSVYVIAD